MGFPKCLSGNLSASAGATDLIPDPERFLEEGLQYFCLENPMDRGDWWATVRGVTKEPDMTEWVKQKNAACGILVSWPGIEPRLSAVKMLSLNHWIARKVPNILIYFLAELSFRCIMRHLLLWCTCWLWSMGSRVPGLSSCSSWAELLSGMRDLPRSGMESVFPALQGRFLTIRPPGKSLPLPSFCEKYFCIQHSKPPCTSEIKMCQNAGESGQF